MGKTATPITSPQVGLAQGEGLLGAANGYGQVMDGDNPAQSLGNFDPNQMDLNKAMEAINKNYADYVTSPVTPALEALASTTFDPKMAAYRNLGGKGVQQGSIMTAIQGAAEGIKQGLGGNGIGGSGGGAGGVGGASALENAKFAKTVQDTQYQHEQDIKTQLEKLNTDFKAKPEVGKAIGTIGAAEDFFNLAQLYVPVKGEDGKMHTQVTDQTETDRMLKSAAMKTIQQAMRIAGTGEDAAGVDISNAAGIANSIVNKLFTQKQFLTAEEIKSMNYAVKNLYTKAIEIYNNKYDETMKQGISAHLPAQNLPFYMGQKQNEIKYPDLDSLKEEHINERVKSANVAVAGQKKQADIGIGNTTELTPDETKQGYQIFNGKKFDKSGKEVK